MFTKSLRLICVSTLLGLVLVVAASAQDFQKSYRLSPGGSIRIGNISGDVTVTGYDGDAIIVTGTKEGSNPDVVQIEDLSNGNSVEIGVHYPRHCNDCDASVQFQVQVPRSINYEFNKIHSISGSVKVSGVTGRVDASSVSGTVSVTDVAGSVSAKSVSGDVDVEINRLDGNGDMAFTTVSGDVNVKVPQGLDAQVDLSSFSGGIDTNLPLQIQKNQYTTAQKASGQIGSGSRRLHMSTVSGSVSLKQM